MHNNFVEDTEKFFKFALSKEDDDSLNWKAVENYIKGKRYQIQGLCYVNFSYDKYASSPKFGEILLNILTEFRCDYKSLLTTLTDLITIFSMKTIYLSNYTSSYKRECYVKTAINNLEDHTENSIFPENEGIQVYAALRGNYQFMEIIVKYGLVKSFSNESLLFKARTEQILAQLM